MKPVVTDFEVARISLQHIRGFRALDLDIRNANGAPRKRTLIIGNNGTCKSTLLRTLAVGLADETDDTSLISEPIGGWVSGDHDTGMIEIELHEANEPPPCLVSRKELRRTGDKTFIKRQLEIDKDWSKVIAAPPNPFVCGYGAGRFGPGPDTGRSYRIADSVATLFRYEQTLIDPELTLHRLQSNLSTEIYNRTILGIKNTLGLDREDDIRPRQSGGVEIFRARSGSHIPLESWADGYRLTFSWLLDLYAWAMKAERIDEHGHITGILLIDEIEQHLHPSMQAEILPRLSELLPKMQIFATTHSPLVALDAKPDELVVLRRDGKYVVAEENIPNYIGYSAEDMLTDPRLFDTEAYGTETREKLSEYRELASIPQEERNPEQRKRLRSLATEIQSFEAPPAQESETTRLLKELVAKYNL